MMKMNTYNIFYDPYGKASTLAGCGHSVLICLSLR